MKTFKTFELVNGITKYTVNVTLDCPLNPAEFMNSELREMLKLGIFDYLHCDTGPAMIISNIPDTKKVIKLYCENKKYLSDRRVKTKERIAVIKSIERHLRKTN